MLNQAVLLLSLSFNIATVFGLYEFAGSCTPPQYLLNKAWNGCQIIITAMTNDAIVTISTVEGNVEVTVPGLTSYVYDMSPQFYLGRGLESKGILISSDEMVKVIFHKQSLERYPSMIDVYDIAETNKTGMHYYSLTLGLDVFCTALYYVDFFFSIVAQQDNTEIEVYEQGDLINTININRFETYTECTVNPYNNFVTGLEFRSNVKFSIIAGNLCFAPDRCPTSAISSMRPVELYGQEYFVPPVGAADSGGYTINVLASEDNTEVSYEGTSSTIDKGENVVIQYAGTDQGFLLQCSQPCYVVQYPYSVRYVKGSYSQNVIPVSSYTREAVFSTVDDYDTDKYLSIVTQGSAPSEEDNIYLDEEPLDDLPWVDTDGYSFVHTEISPGTHLLTSDGKIFVAYVHSDTDFTTEDCGAYGYAVLGSDDQEQEPEPDPDYTVPRLRIRSNGTTLSADRSTISPSCAAEYSESMDTQASNMALTIDSRLGSDLCEDVNSGDVIISSVQVATVFDDYQMLIRIDNILTFQAAITKNQVLSCAEEIANYISNHENWQRPILPQEPGCPEMEFDPERFDFISNLWLCGQNLDDDDDDTPEVDNQLLYEISINDYLNTTDGSILDIDCTGAYSEAAGSKTAEVSINLNEALSGICDGDVATIIRERHTFTSLGQQVYFQPTFVVQPTDLDAAFSEFLDCTLLLTTWLRSHSNWGNTLIPQPPICPTLEADSGQFEEGNKGWTCVDF